MKRITYRKTLTSEIKARLDEETAEKVRVLAHESGMAVSEYLRALVLQRVRTGRI